MSAVIDPGRLVESLAVELVDWLPARRWFAGKDRAITSVRPVRATELSGDDPTLVHLVVDVDQGGRQEAYQLLVGAGHSVPDYLGPSVIGAVDDVTCYEAAGDPDLAGQLLDLIVAEREIGPLRFAREADAELTGELRPHPIRTEQSNTSLVFGKQYILKLFRRLAAGPNRDLTLHRALHAAGSRHIARPLGSISGEFDGAPVTLGLLQEYLPDAVEGWAMATTSVRTLLADPELPVDQSGGDFAGEAHRLGQAVASVHADLRRALGRQDADRAEFDRTADAMLARLNMVVALVPALATHAPAISAAFERVRDTAESAFLQHIHGDLHLGQTLRTVDGWILIDFEGEPAASAAERAELRSPLRDVAGMLRSFDYAAHEMLVGQPEDPDLTAHAVAWARRNRAAFCDGYTEASTDELGELGDPRTHADLLTAFELDKAVYEVAYEYANRPEWLDIPLTSIDHLTTGGE